MEHNTQNLPQTCQPAPAYAAAPPSYFTDLTAFEAVQRMAGLLAASDMVPKQYQKSVANCVLALEVAMQTGSSPFFVMQNLNIIQGKPGWAAQFVAALLNSSRRFRGGLRYEMDNDDNPTTCRVWAIDAATGERLNGPTVSLEMARKEGWTDRLGSKWKTMPEVMLGYRAVTFFARRHAPELLLGMRTDDELRDMGEEAAAPAPPPERATPTQATPAQVIDALIDAKENSIDAEADAVFEEAAAPEPEAPRATIEESSTVPAPEPEATHKENLSVPAPAPEAEPAEPRPIPPRLAKYLDAKGEKPRPVPPPPDDPTAEQRAAMFKYIKELEGKKGMSLELPGWMERNKKRLIKELGGEDSEFYQAVHEHWMGLEAELK